MRRRWLLISASLGIGALLLAGCPAATESATQDSSQVTSGDIALDEDSDGVGADENQHGSATSDSRSGAPDLVAIIDPDEDEPPPSFSFTDDDLTNNDPSGLGSSTGAAGLSISWFDARQWPDDVGIINDPNIDLILEPITPVEPNLPISPPGLQPPAQSPSNPGTVDIVDTVHLLRQTFAALVALHPMTQPILDLEELGDLENTAHRIAGCPKLVLLFGTKLGAGLFYYGEDGAGCASTELGDHTFYGAITHGIYIQSRKVIFEYPNYPNPMVVQHWTFDDIATWGEYSAVVSNVYESPMSETPDGRSMIGVLDLTHDYLGTVNSQNFSYRVYPSGRIEIDGAFMTLNDGETVTIWIHDIVVDPSQTGSFLPLGGDIAYQQNGQEHKLIFKPTTPSTRQVTHLVGGNSETITLPNY